MSITLAKIPNGVARPSVVPQPCAWCYRTAILLITVPGEWSASVWTDPACHDHAVEHFGASIPTPRPTPRCGTCGGRVCSCNDRDRDWA